MATTTFVPLEEYLTTVYEPDCDYVDGEVLERNMGETDHGGLQTVLAAWLYARRKQLGIHVFTETRTQVAPKRFRIPDIAVTTSRPNGRILREPPFVCIEILSPEDRVSRIEDRIEDYLKFGVPHVWLLDPARKRAWSYTKEGKREPADILTTDMPRIELPVAELFAELAQEIEEGQEP